MRNEQPAMNNKPVSKPKTASDNAAPTPTVGANAPEVNVPSASSRLSSSILVFGLLLTGIGGAFLPWIWRESVALQLTAPGLAEFVKFLPDLRLGQVDVQRLYFLLPLFLAMLALPLFSANKALALPIWLRWGLRLAVLPLALASLSPVWTPTILIAPEFRLQTGLAGLAIGLAVVAPLLRHLPLKWLIFLLIAAGLAALVLPVWQFRLIEAAMAEAYGQPVALGWGWWLTAAGLILSMVGGLWRLLTP
jgi:hypothetical protein